MVGACAVLLSRGGAFEWWYHYTRRHEALELDEWTLCLVAALFVGMIFAIRHLFMLKSLMRELEAANHRIVEQNQLQARQEKLAALGELSSGMAHEINNALQPALGLGPFVRKGLEEKGNPRHLEYMDLILNSAYHMQGIIENVLAYTRDKSTELTRYNTLEMLHEALEFSTSILPSTLIFEAQEPDRAVLSNTFVEANKTAAMQIFANILKNAADAMEGAGTIRIVIQQETLPTDTKKPAVCVRVIDRGCGMEPQTIERVFDPFFTTKDISTGTGLGLSVVQGLVHQHQGCITVQSAVGVGSSFNVYFPLAA